MPICFLNVFITYILIFTLFFKFLLSYTVFFVSRNNLGLFLILKKWSYLNFFWFIIQSQVRKTIYFIIILRIIFILLIHLLWFLIMYILINRSISIFLLFFITAICETLLFLQTARSRILSNKWSFTREVTDMFTRRIFWIR